MGIRYHDGSAFEAQASYARAAREGPMIVLSGTAALSPDGSAEYKGDTYKQTLVAFERGMAAIAELGGTREGVFRTRIYLAPDADWHGAVRAHHEVFEGVDPANTTFVVSAFIPQDVLVEVEADAWVENLE